MTRIGIVAAEPSGDQLASHLMSALRQLDPDIEFEGIGGTRMQEHDFSSWFPMEKLSVMGIAEVVKHLPELLAIRKSLVKRWIADPPDIFIGVDAPDFNLGLEKKLKAAGIPTVQYVCPTIWAWRQGRVSTLKQGVDLVLSIFPFEVPLLEKHRVKACYAGHPLAQDLDQVPDQSVIRHKLGLPLGKPVLGLLPGSRMSEASQLTDDFLQAAGILNAQLGGLIVLAPMATAKIREYFTQRANAFDLDIRILDGQSRDVMAAADVLLLASGTASLETMLYKKPMVVAYKIHWLTYFIGFTLGLVKTKYIAMPNILADEELVPELFQDNCTPENIANAVYQLFSDKDQGNQLKSHFETLHEELAEGSIEQAAQAIMSLVGK